jgi:hypothetical protein
MSAVGQGTPGLGLGSLVHCACARPHMGPPTLNPACLRPPTLHREPCANICTTEAPLKRLQKQPLMPQAQPMLVCNCPAAAAAAAAGDAGAGAAAAHMPQPKHKCMAGSRPARAPSCPALHAALPCSRTLETMMALSMESASLGSPPMSQPRMVTGQPSTAASLKASEQGTAHARQRSTHWDAARSR